MTTSTILVSILCCCGGLVLATTPTPSAEATHHHVHVNNDNEHHKQIYNQHHQHQHSTNSRVLELSDRFLDIVNTAVPSNNNAIGPDALPKYQPWIVKFYAPWCGHCKRLEPIFNHVAQALHNTPIRVGRVDCTRFPSVGSEFKIHGYPTIMFISGPDRKIVFQGDRDVPQIVRFAKRMASPAVTLSPLPLQDLILKHKSSAVQSMEHNPARVKREEIVGGVSGIDEKPDLFFGIVKGRSVGVTGVEVVTAFQTVAGKYQQHNEFYEFIEDGVENPKVFVFKNGRVLLFDEGVGGANRNLTGKLEMWVGNERFPDFIHFSRGNLHQVFSEKAGEVESKDLIVVAVVEEDKLLRVVRDDERRLLQIIHEVSQISAEEETADFPLLDPTTRVTRTRLPVHYGWIGTPDLANSIVAEHLPLPTLLIIEKSPEGNHKYFVFSDWPAIDSSSKVENLVELVREGHFQPTVYANSMSFRLYRYVFDAKVSLTDMWVGNPVLTIVLFGLPLGFLSLILYSVCCGDIMDAKEEDDVDESEEERNENHEKRE